MTPTWPNIDEMQRGMALMLQGNPYFAWQHVQGNEAPYRPCLDLQQLELDRKEIFNGTKTPGFYSIRQDNMTRWGAIDFDDHDAKGLQWLSKVEAAFKCLSERFDETWMLKTHPGGFHIVSFALNLIPAREVRRALLDIAPEGVEVFPKQDELGQSPNAKGSLLRFPGKHQLKGHWGRFIDHSGRIEVPVEKVGVVKRNEWQSPTEQRRLLSLYCVATRNIRLTSTGQRFDAMKRIGGRLKGRANEDDAIKIFTMWHNRNAANIKTSFKESLVAFRTWFHEAAPCNVEIPAYPLTPEDEDRIARVVSMPNAPADGIREVLRLLLQAKQHADKKGLPAFWLSLPMIADKLGMSIPTACRYRAACVKQGLVELVERGHTGMASTFRLKQ